MLALIASPISTGKEPSTAKASSDSSTRDRDPKSATSAVPSVSAANSAPEDAVPIPESTNSARARL